MRKPFTKVSREVGRNPVARTVAKQMFTHMVRSFQTRLFMLEQGEVVPSDVNVASTILRIFALAAGRHGEPTNPIVRGAESALTQCAARGCIWHTIDAVAIDQAMKHVVVAFPLLPADDVAWAWQQCG